MSSSESEDNFSENATSRLGDCEVCGKTKALYTCPKCEVKTCSLDCVRIHKNELECDGIRDRTKFIRMKDFSDTDLLSDYRLLEECARFVWGVKRDEKKKYTRIDKDLPIHLFKLKMAARKRGTVLQFLAQNFTRHKINTTRYNYKTSIISWRVEWVFPNVGTEVVKFVDEKCSEHMRIATILDKYLNPEVMDFEGAKVLTYYKAVGFNGIKILLKAEKVKGSAKKFFELDPTETLGENLSGKCIVEFPIIFVVLKDHAYNFEVISPEDEFEEAELNQVKENNNNELSTDTSETKSNDNSRSANRLNNLGKRQRVLLTEKIAKEKKIALEKEIKAEKKKRPKNLLFTTGYSSEESLGYSDNNEDTN